MQRRVTGITRPLLLILLTMTLGLAACAAPAPAPGAAPQPGAASAAPRAVSDVATYRGSDRQQVLEEGARREGKLVWYTSLIVNQAVRPLVEGFNKKYPYIQVEHWRANGAEIAQRVILEYQAGRHEVDLADGGTTPLLLRESGFAQAFHSPPLDAYPAHLKDKEGYWGTPNLYFNTLGYNTRLVSKQDVPKTYQDLLDPRWKGQLAWSTNVGAGGAPLLMGTLLESMGQERGMAYLNQLSRQEMRNLPVAARNTLDMVIAGEFPIALQIFNHHAAISAQQGAPVDWVPLEPVPAVNAAISMPARAPNPHAALLFLDYLFAPDGGQQVMREVDYLPAHPQVEAKIRALKPEQGGYQASFLPIEAAFQKEPQWAELFETMFLR